MKVGLKEMLDEQSPDACPLRVASFYACCVLKNCQAFIGNKRIEDQNPNFYKVEMDFDLGFPMVLFDRIRKLGQASVFLITVFQNIGYQHVNGSIWNI
jgi:hypothetical protein